MPEHLLPVLYIILALVLSLWGWIYWQPSRYDCWQIARTIDLAGNCYTTTTTSKPTKGFP